MAPRNPSELQRLTEEYQDLKNEWKKGRLKYPKSYLEEMFRDIRKLEDILEIPEEKRISI